jgi:hypothetical protein
MEGGFESSGKLKEYFNGFSGKLEENLLKTVSETESSKPSKTNPKKFLVCLELKDFQ